MTMLGLVTVSGSDAKKLLQGQLTCDLESITPTQGSFAAHCNPQGRIISFFYLCQHQQDYCLIMPRSMIDIAIQALKKYAVFYKVTLTDASDTLKEVIQQYPANALSQGIPMIYPETSGKFLPHDIHLHQTGAISFNKGCYTGQEIIARMHYRGKLKNHLYHASIQSNKAPTPGADIFNLASQTAGVLVDATPITPQQYDTLIITDDSNAKDHHLYLDDQQHTFYNLKNTLGDTP